MFFFCTTIYDSMFLLLPKMALLPSWADDEETVEETVDPDRSGQPAYQSEQGQSESVIVWIVEFRFGIMEFTCSMSKCLPYQCSCNAMLPLLDSLSPYRCPHIWLKISWTGFISLSLLIILVGNIILIHIKKYTNKLSLDWAPAAVRVENIFCASVISIAALRHLNQSFIGLKVCLPLKAISFVFPIACTSVIEEGEMLICELMAFLSRIANSLKCHNAQRVGSQCHPKNQSRRPYTPPP